MQGMLRHDLLAGTDVTTAAPGDFLHFKAHVPLRHIWVGNKHWRYYQSGPKLLPPLVCLGGTSSTAEVFYKIILSLSAKGYHVIAADAPPVWSHQEWIASFEKFLDQIGAHHVHLYGTSLGGYLSQLFAQQRPRRVKSLLLSNTFLETHTFASGTSWKPLISWTPEFMLKRYILSGIHEGPQEPLIADSIDFVVSQFETLSREDLASRLTLNTSPAAVGQITLPDSCITIMDTNDYCAIPQSLKDQVAARYPTARKAMLKSGGDFPFLSRAAEVSLHVQLHLMRVGVEGVPDARPIPSPGSGGSGDSAGDDQYQGRSPDGDRSSAARDEPSSSSPAATDRSFSPSAMDSFKRLGLANHLQVDLQVSHLFSLLCLLAAVQEFWFCSPLATCPSLKV
ncbi:maspardin [Selaginella moellendorffii]|nr:maspardin [Selaginella moellendorffii]|eukprot:XP_002992732.2 maspardin [Selaginella moellendorffii]